MKTYLIILLAVLFSGCNNKDSYSDSYKEIELLNAEFNEAIAKKDLNRIVNLYSKKMIWLPPNEVRKFGIEPVKLNYSFITENGNVGLSHQIDTIFISKSNDLAVMIGTYYFKMTGEKELYDTGKFSLTLVKEKGNWKISTDLFNSDLKH